MLFSKWYMIGCLLGGTLSLFAQSGPSSLRKFTWEGAFEGNKAIWKADDTLNVYKDVYGVDVTVKLLDSFKLNTTTANPSEFNDWTKTNTFFRRGSLAFQIVSRGKKQAACMEFSFSRPVLLSKFQVWDIDILMSSENPWSTYQDSLHFYGSNDTGSVRIDIVPLSKTPIFTIRGHEVKANYVAGMNNDIAYNNPDGAIIVSSEFPLTKFTVCYANGSEDDGLSNSHAIRMPMFEFAEILGSISGYVREDLTDRPLAGSVLRLLDASGNPVYNREGKLMEATTGDDGSYIFGYLPLGKYTILQTNPTGYESVREADGTNDNQIEVKLDFLNYVSGSNDFYEKLLSPLPVVISGLNVRNLSGGEYILEWTAETEQNNDYYTIYLSQDGHRFSETGKVKSLNRSGSQYYYTFTGLNADIFYVKLGQTDYDGKIADAGIVAVRPDKGNKEIAVYPNPARDLIRIMYGAASGTADLILYDMCGRVVYRESLTEGATSSSVDVSGLPGGIYSVRLQGRSTSATSTFIIR